MKLNDNKFIEHRRQAAADMPDVNTIKAAVNPDASLENLFDKIAQDIMMPTLGEPPPEKPPALIPRFDGMWDQGKIKREFRRMRSTGMTDADDAVRYIVELGAAGNGADNPVVQNYLRALWFNSMSLTPFKEWLYKRASVDLSVDDNMIRQILSMSDDTEELDTSVEASLGGDTLSTEDIEGTGKIAQQIPNMPGVTDTGSQDQMPALPGSESDTPGPSPDDIFNAESDLSLSEAIEQLQEAADVVVDKVQNGETIINGKDAEPSMPQDTGSTPSPAPKIAAEERSIEDIEKEFFGDSWAPSGTRTDSGLLRQKMDEVRRDIRRRMEMGLPPLSEEMAKQKPKDAPGVYVRKPGGDMKPVGPKHVPPPVNIPAQEDDGKPKKKLTQMPLEEAFPNRYRKVEEQAGPEIMELVLMRDKVQELYHRERKSAPVQFYLDEDMASISSYIGSSPSGGVTYKEAVPPPILLKLEQSKGNLNVLTEDELRAAYASMQGLYEADREARAAWMRATDTRSPSYGRPVKVKNQPKIKTAPQTKSKQELRDMINKMLSKHPEKVRKGSSSKESVDQAAKQYWIDLFGEYGEQMTDDRVANIVDMAEDVLSANGISLSDTEFNKLIAFVASEPEDEGGFYSAVTQLAARDPRFANVVDKMLLNYAARIMIPTHEDLPSSIKSTAFVMAMHESGNHDNIMRYVAQKMKIPSVSNQPDDVVDVDEIHDVADDSESAVKTYHIDMTVEDTFKRGSYTHYVVKWDPDDDDSNKSEEGMKQAVISFIKGIESTKEFKDIGFIGQIHFEEFDPEAGTAEVYFNSSKPGDSPVEVRS